MKCIKIILALLISIVQIGCGQDGIIGYEKLVTTIKFHGISSDTTIQNIKFDPQGNRIVELPKYISNPIEIDTIRISDIERRIEYTWEDNSKSVTKVVKTHKNEIKIGLDNNGTDTTYYSKFNLTDEGFPTKGIIINHGDTSKYEISNKISMSEIIEIQSNIISESDFINLIGIIQILNKREIIITDLKESRNKIEIYLNKKLKPKKVLIRKWHEYHKMVFENKYLYKYKDDKLVEMKNLDMYGDLEMIRTIDYKLE